MSIQAAFSRLVAAAGARRWSKLAATLALCVGSGLFGGTSGGSSGGAPLLAAESSSVKVQFDVANLVACRDITSNEFAAANPGERIREARFQVSVLSQAEPGQEVAELLIRIESPDHTAQVADYFPKTTLTSDYVGPMKVEQHREQSQSLEFNFAAQGPAAHAGASGAKQSSVKLHTLGQQLPPMELCAASGTVGRGHGVYFKLCPTARTSLEGSHDLILHLRTPDIWRADYLLVSCEAFGVRPGLLGSPATRARCGARSFIVAAHQDGDAAAKGRAAQLVRAERELREAAAVHHRQLKKQASSDPLREFEKLFQGGDRRIPADWLEQTLFGPGGTTLPFDAKLPGEVRVAALNYRDARRQVRRLQTDPQNAAPRVGATTVKAGFVSADEPPLRRLPPVVLSYE